MAIDYDFMTARDDGDVHFNPAFVLGQRFFSEMPVKELGIQVERKMRCIIALRTNANFSKNDDRKSRILEPDGVVGPSF